MNVADAISVLMLSGGLVSKKMIRWIICVIYIDDILIYANSAQELIERTEIVFQRLGEHNVAVNPDKSYFGLCVIYPVLCLEVDCHLLHIGLACINKTPATR